MVGCAARETRVLGSTTQFLGERLHAVSTRIPKYRKHRSGQARVTFAGKTYYLGKYNTPGSRQRYKELVNEWLTRTGRFAPETPASPATPGGPTVNELALEYVKHAEVYYQTNPKEVEKVKLSIRPLRTLFGRTAAATFDGLALEAVQGAMIEAGLARTTVNERIRVLKRLFKWGVRKKLVPAPVYGELLTVEGLKRGRTKARETGPVKPVPDEHVDAVLPLVSRHVAGMIRLQLLTGARPGEVCTLRRADIEMDGRVWVYRPQRHKNLWRGHPREIFLGPKAQELITQFFRADLSAYLFCPRLAREERYRELRATRKSKVQPSQISRRKPNPKKVPGERYTTASFRQAVRKACGAAGIPTWHPHQLRHNAATALRREHGIELARIILGQRHLSATELYAEADQEQAKAVMARIG
jgi:integrase